MKYFIILMFLFLSSCATPHVTKIVMDGDEDLIANSGIMKLQDLHSLLVRLKKKGVNWANAGRLIFFQIGIGATYENANQAIDAANQRKVYLTGVKRRNCCI